MRIVNYEMGPSIITRKGNMEGTTYFKKLIG